MLYIIATVVGIIAGIAAKGSLANLANVRIEKKGIIFSAFCIQLFAQILSVKGFSIIIRYSLIIYIIVYGLLITAFWFNRKYWGILVVGTGSFLNALVITLNNGKMPVSMEALSRANMLHTVEILKSGVDGKHILINESSRLTFLADIIAPPYFLNFLMRIVSIGDIVLVIGLALLVFEIVSGRSKVKLATSREEVA